MFRGKSTSRELQQHIVTGQPVNQPGHGIASDLDDASLVYENPDEFGGSAQTFEGQDENSIMAASDAECAGLDSGDAGIGRRGDISMSLASTNHGQDTTQADSIAYGPNAADRWREDNGL